MPEYLLLPVESHEEILFRMTQQKGRAQTVLGPEYVGRLRDRGLDGLADALTDNVATAITRNAGYVEELLHGLTTVTVGEYTPDPGPPTVLGIANGWKYPDEYERGLLAEGNYGSVRFDVYQGMDLDALLGVIRDLPDPMVVLTEQSSPTNYDVYVAWASDMMETLTSYGVRHFQFWNEPNLGTWTDSQLDYIDLLNRVHAVAPEGVWFYAAGIANENDPRAWTTAIVDNSDALLCIHPYHHSDPSADVESTITSMLPVDYDEFYAITEYGTPNVDDHAEYLTKASELSMYRPVYYYTLTSSNGGGSFGLFGSALPPPPDPEPEFKLFDAASEWNIPVGDHAPTPAPGRWQNVTASLSIDEWTVPVYREAPSDPRVNIQLTRGWWGVDVMKGVPLPDGADGDPVGDGHMVIIGLDGCIYEFWQFRRSTLSASQGNVLPGGVNGTGWYETGASSTGCGASLLGGLIMADELQNGYIPHALAFSSPGSMVAGDVRNQATESDGSSTDSDAMPYGTRFWTPERLTSSNPVVDTIYRAAFEFGLILRDRGGSNFGIYAESRAAHPELYEGLEIAKWEEINFGNLVYADEPRRPESTTALADWTGCAEAG